MQTPEPGGVAPADVSPLAGAFPDPTIRMDGYVPPLPRRRTACQPRPAVWAPPPGRFPSAPEWEVTPAHAAAWANHRFAGHFSKRVLRLIGNPEGHPLFELRLDLLHYEVLFARFVGIPHNPHSRVVAWFAPDHPEDPWYGPPEPARPAPWTPPPGDRWDTPAPLLASCLARSCRDYAAGLADYLLPGREEWGRG